MRLMRAAAGLAAAGRAAAGLGAIGLGLWLGIGAAAAAEGLALKRVMLSTGGVGYFEYEAKVDGAAELPLTVRLDQVNDVLKSIVVYDDRGGIGEISLPGEQPLREAFRELPFSAEALGSPVTLLNALKGAEIKVVGAKEVTGRLMAVVEERTQLPNNGGTLSQQRVSVMTAGGMRQFLLHEVDALQFVDPKLQAQVERALAALARHSERDRRTIAIKTTGNVARTVRVAYVVEAPLWKAAYRLTLSDDPDAAKADLQGWAVIENLSGEDWADVDLTVVSGNPVTFRQALYAAYYVQRPWVPVEVLGRVLPPADRGTVGGSVATYVAPPPPPAPAGALLMDRAYAGRPRQAEEAAKSAPPPLARFEAAESSEAATQAIFRFPHPVSVASGHSLLAPLVAREVPAMRLSLYQPGVQAEHPLASVLLTNDSDNGLPPGVLTLYERSAKTGDVAYVGDARLNPLPVGEKRLVSFAVDQKVKIDRKTEESQTLAQGKIVDGVLSLTYTDREVATYSIVGAAREKRRVTIEHPRREDWKLLEPAEGTVESTIDQYRIAREVAPGTTVTLKVVSQRPRLERLEVLSLSVDQIRVYAQAKELMPALRDAFARLGAYLSDINARQTQLNALDNEQKAIFSDQERVRRNLGSVPRDGDLYRRYLTQLSEQEDRLTQIKTEQAALRKAIDDAREAMAKYARGLNL